MDEITARVYPIKEKSLLQAERIGGTEFRITGARRMFDAETFKRRYGLTLILAAAFTLYTILLSAWVDHRAEVRTRAELEAEYQRMLTEYQEQQQLERSKEYFLSGDASREAAINQATDAVAAVIAKLGSDQQKLTEAACILARVISPNYPNSFQEVAAQPQQWMFYDGSDNTFTEHDRELADSIVRPYMESGVIPNGLTAEMVYGHWTQTDFVLRDKWEADSGAHYWRYGT